MGLRALERGQPSAVDGVVNYLRAQTERLAPRSVMARVMERMMRPHQAPSDTSPQLPGSPDDLVKQSTCEWGSHVRDEGAGLGT